MSKKFVVSLINLYQKTLSPDHGWLKFLGGTCRYYPTCSEYTKEAVDKFGVIKGLTLGSKRVGRCHPYSAGGYDPLPMQKPKTKNQNDGVRRKNFSISKPILSSTICILAFPFLLRFL